MSIAKKDAEQIARQYLESQIPTLPPMELVLLVDETIERDFGWVFFYDSKTHLETGNVRDALAGNAPIVVTRADGRVHVTGTAHPVEYYLKAFGG